jgi:hypothetical protein
MAKVRVVVAMAAVLLWGAAPARAAGPPATVTMFSEAGDYIGQGEQQAFDTSAGDTITATASQGGLHVTAGGYDFEFVAPDGQALSPGVYTGAQRAPFHDADAPGIDVYGDGRGCNEIAGSFEVRDLRTDATGAVQSAWVLYEQHCEGGAPALFGEVRIGAPAAAGPHTVSSLVRWPAHDLGSGGQAVPVWVSDAAPITSVSVVGDAAADFPVRLDDCTGTAPASPCDVWVRFVPTAAGVREAWLRVADAAGGVTEVPLEAFAYGGTTGLTMQSDAGDWVGHGQSYSYGPTSSYGISGSRSGVHVSVDGANGDWWYLDFVPSSGDILAPGTYDGATRYPFNGTGAGLSVDGNGAGCNQLDGSFTVNELTFAAGAVRTMSISFVQHCEHATPALHGTISFRAGDRTAPAPWMVSGNPPTDTGTPSDAAPPSGGGAGSPAATTSAAHTGAPPAVAPSAAPAAISVPATGTRAHQAAATQAVRLAADQHRLSAALTRLKPSTAAHARAAAARLQADLRALGRRRDAAAAGRLRAVLARYAAHRASAAAVRRAARALRRAA